MLSVEGINYKKLPPPLDNLLNFGKNPAKGADKLIVLLEHQKNLNVTAPVRKANRYLRQVVQVKTLSKYIDITVKKANCHIELNSSSNFALKYDCVNQDFLCFLKNFLNGRCNLSSMKLAQALELHIVESVHFEVLKYSDSLKIIDQVSNQLPSALRKFGFTYDDTLDMGAQIDDEENFKVDQKLSNWVKTYPKMEILVQKSNSESQIRMYYTPIMQTCYQAGPASQALTH